MSVSPEYAENLASSVVDLYQDAERIMLERIGRALAKDMDAPDWAERKLLQIQLLQSQTARQLQQLTGRSAEEIAAAIVKAHNRGVALAETDLRHLVKGSLGASSLPPGLPAVEALVSEAVTNVVSTHGQILRSTMDIYRTTIAETAPQVLLGTQTRREAAQSALNRFAAKGIGGFVDKSGKRWNMNSYVEMSTRAATANAAIDGHVGRLQAAGHDLVIVSDAPQECSLCRPFEGRILSTSGVARVDGVDVYATLEQARGRGFQHVNCRHSVSIYLPGVTTKPKGRTADPQGDKDRQKLRYLERQTRAAKRTRAVALSPEAERAAAAKVRAYQAKIRSHVDTTTAKRIPTRERLGVL